MLPVDRLAVWCRRLRGATRGHTYDPDRNKGAILGADASRLAASLVGHMHPACSLLAPCDPGASAPMLGTLISVRVLSMNAAAATTLRIVPPCVGMILHASGGSYTDQRKPVWARKPRFRADRAQEIRDAIDARRVLLGVDRLRRLSELAGNVDLNPAAALRSVEHAVPGAPVRRTQAPPPPP